MASRGRNLTFRPHGLSDAVDGSNAPAGAMAQLANLVPDPTGTDMWVARPAAAPVLVDFAAGGFNAPGFVSSALVVGDMLYGTIASARNAGHDEPFAYDLAAAAFRTVAGIASGNTPLSPAATGAWTPPVLAQIGTRVIVTHPGFLVAGIKFGWFDVSNASLQITADTSILTTANNALFLTGNLPLLAVQPGMTVSGAGVPANTTVAATYPVPLGVNGTGTTTAGSAAVSVAECTNFIPTLSIAGSGIQPGTTISARSAFSGAGTITLSLPATANGNTVLIVTGDNSSFLVFSPTAGSATVGVSTTGALSGLAVGQQVAGQGLPATATYITAINLGLNQVTLSNPATLSLPDGVNWTITGAVIQLSQAVTATTTGVTITLAGGSKTAPLWGAGDTDRAALPSIPVGVAQMNGRAYYACGTDGIAWSDSLLPCRRSNTLAVQTLTTGDGLAVTAIAPLLLSAPLTGGIVQALIAFEGAAKMQQITGDQATGTLAINALSVATGTLAPLSLAPTELGLMFISPQGLRLIKFDGSVSPIIGEGGSGITGAFSQAAQASRVCAAANVDVLRVTTQNAGAAGSPYQEYFYDLVRQVWSGPHSSAFDLIQPWRSTFLGSLHGVAAKLFQADSEPVAASVYTENGTALTWTYRPTPLPDAGDGAMIALIEMTMALSLTPLATVTLTAAEISGDPLDTTSLTGGRTAFVLGHAILGHAFLGAGAYYQQYPVDWTQPLVFRQLALTISGASDANLRLGNLYLKYQPLGYKLQGTP